MTAESTLAGWRLGGAGTFAAAVIVMLPIAALPASAQAARSPTGRSPASHPYAVYVVEAARRFGVPEAWIWAVMRAESGGDARAVSRAGAIGAMQIMPSTWATLRVRYGLGPDPFDVRANILAGTAYLRELHDRYGSVGGMLAAYNAGPGRYDDYLSRGQPLPAETIGYLVQLAPIIGVPAATQTTAIAPPDPFAWRRATLFVRTADIVQEARLPQTGGEISAIEPQPDRPASGADAAAAAPPGDQADRLFVSRARAGRPQ